MMTMFAICIIMKLVSSSQRSVIYNMHIVVHDNMHIVFPWQLMLCACESKDVMKQLLSMSILLLHI
jgi:hypothetical protein